MSRSARLAVIVAFGLCLTHDAHSQQTTLRTVHVFVALADNQHQGIVPVPAHLGNGEDAANNLYWGSAYGVKAFFSHATEWKRIACTANPKPAIRERCTFRYKAAPVYLIADAYRGIEIKQAILDFFYSASGAGADAVPISDSGGGALVNLPAHGGANLLVYIGHDGLMDFQIPRYPNQKDAGHRETIVLACASRQFFADGIKASGAYPLLWTTNLMAPEAYTLKSALDGWIAEENREQIRERAAGAYDKYQKCGARAARRLLVSGW
jgi:hypothetical protein